MGFAKPIEQYLFGNLLTEIQVIMYLKDIIRGENEMNTKKLLRYTMQLAMLKQLLTKKLIDENEYLLIQKRLMKDYGVVSNITA